MEDKVQQFKADLSETIKHYRKGLLSQEKYREKIGNLNLRLTRLNSQIGLKAKIDLYAFFQKKLVGIKFKKRLTQL